MTLLAAASMTTGAKAGGYDICPILGDTTKFLFVCGFQGFGGDLLARRRRDACQRQLQRHDARARRCHEHIGLRREGRVLVDGRRQHHGEQAHVLLGLLNEGSATASTTNTSFFQDATTGIPMGKIGLAPANGDASGDVIGVVWSTGYAASTAASATSMLSASIQHATLTGSGTTVTVSANVAQQFGVQLASRPVFGAQYSNAYVAVSTPSSCKAAPTCAS